MSEHFGRLATYAEVFIHSKSYWTQGLSWTP